MNRTSVLPENSLPLNTLPVLVVEDDPHLREAICDSLELKGLECVGAENGQSALLELKKRPFSLVVSDIQMPKMSGEDLLATVRKQWPSLPFVLMTAYGSVKGAVANMQLGAAEYLEKPFSPDELFKLIEPHILTTADKPLDADRPVAESAESKKVFELARKVAAEDVSVLITGPSGAGKEVLARFLHRHSPRRDQPFVAINCAAIPDNMLEATLFGYEKGAFTGAHQSHEGKFEQANGGTLLLDEVSEMAPGLQAKLLRVIQEKEVERLGGKKVIALDVRILATSNRDLKQAVKQGDFREDLYYRLNVMPLHLSGLAKRKADILPLAKSLVRKHAARMGKGEPRLCLEVERKLLAHAWAGNVRELDNVMQRALLLSDDGNITADHLMFESNPQNSDATTYGNDPSVNPTGESNGRSNANAGSKPLEESVKEQEYLLILEALKNGQAKKQDIAKQLGISPRTLRYKIARMREDGYEIPA